MKLKLFFILFANLVFTSCYNKSDPETDMDNLKSDDAVIDDHRDDDEKLDNDEEETGCRFINTAIASNDSGDIYVVGYTRDNGNNGCDYLGFVKKLENNNWKTVYECGGPGVECASASPDIWLGNKGEISVAGMNGLLLFEESGWNNVYFGDNDSIADDVWGVSLTDLFAAGQSGYPSEGAIFHFDGKELIKMEIPISNDLNGIWGTGPDNVYAVGEKGTILHYDGEEWTEMESGTAEYLSSIWGINKQDIYVAGENVIVHFNGEKWIETLKDEESFFLGIHGLVSDSILAVGRTISETPEAVAFHYNGQKWKKIEMNIKSILYDVLALPDGSFYVVGDNNTIERIAL